MPVRGCVDQCKAHAGLNEALSQLSYWPTAPVAVDANDLCKGGMLGADRWWPQR